MSRASDEQRAGGRSEAAEAAAENAFAAADAETEELGFEEIDEEGEVRTAPFRSIDSSPAAMDSLGMARSRFHPPVHALTPCGRLAIRWCTAGARQVTVGGRMNAPASPGRCVVRASNQPGPLPPAVAL
jgi:hypothetical protein